jgi:hypothetical protein
MPDETENVEVVFQPIDNQVLAYYQKLLQGFGLQSFQEKVLPLARRILSLRPEIYKQNLESLIHLAANQPQARGNIDQFWTTEVTADTFEFQRNFAQLSAPSSIAPAENVFHINRQEMLKDAEQRGGQLLPAYVLENRPYNQEEDEGFGTETLHFASGSVDNLSRFLVGFGLIDKTKGWKPRDFLTVNGLRFRDTQALAVAAKSATEYSGLHDIDTLYAPTSTKELIDIFVSRVPTPIEVVSFPVTVLLPHQVQNLLTEGEAAYKRGDFEEVFKVSPENEHQAGNVYALSKHLELMMKMILLKYPTNPLPM